MNNFKQLFDLTGKRVLITGAGRPSGIGAAIAQGFADFGAEVALHDITLCDEVKKSIEQSGAKCHVFQQDLALKGAGKKLIHTVEDSFGPLDIVVTNASYQVVGDYQDISSDQLEALMNINFRAHFDILQSVLPKMAARRSGRIVHMGSINQRSPKAIVSVYGAMKAAQHNLIISLAREYAQQGICLNSIAPGLVDTYPENRAGDETATKAWDDYAAQLNWMGRAGKPDEIVGAAIYLGSSASGFMTGETLYPTGGF